MSGVLLVQENGAMHGASNCDKHDAKKIVANLDIVLGFSLVFGRFCSAHLDQESALSGQKNFRRAPYFGFGGTPAMAYVMQSHR